MVNVVVGLGSGRCGTHSLQKLLNRQLGFYMVHEMNSRLVIHEKSLSMVIASISSLVNFSESKDVSDLIADCTEPKVIRFISDVETAEEVKFVGDCGHYYLPYVSELVAKYPNIKMVCLKRDKQQTVESWIRKTKVIKKWTHGIKELFCFFKTGKFRVSENRWQTHDGTQWKKNAKWDKCFPKYNGVSYREAIEKYYDYYYDQAEVYQQTFPENFHIFDMNDLNSEEGRSAILEFVGCEEQLLQGLYHEDKT